MNKITCTNCKKSKGITPDRVEALTKKYGSLDNLVKSYLCRDCRKGKEDINPNKKVDEKENSGRERDVEGKLILPDWLRRSIKKDKIPYTAKELRDNVVCYRPDYWVFNNHVCNGCPMLLAFACGCNTIMINRNNKMVRLDPKDEKYENIVKELQEQDQKIIVKNKKGKR